MAAPWALPSSLGSPRAAAIQITTPTALAAKAGPASPISGPSGQSRPITR